MNINVNGKEVEAYDLLMKKDNALDIISGKKTLEIRVFSNHYATMFTDPKQLAKNEELRKAGKDDDCVEPLKSIQYIHFHNYNNSWSLDVKIDEIGLSSMTEEDIEDLHDFGFHDYDNDWQQYKDKDLEDVPMFYWMHIKEILGKKNIQDNNLNLGIMSEPYAMSVNQKTGSRQYYQTKKDYIKGRIRKSDSARKRRSRVLG